MLSDEWLSRYGLLENFNASVTRTGTGTHTGTGTWTTGVTAIALCTLCSRANDGGLPIKLLISGLQIDLESSKWHQIIASTRTIYYCHMFRFIKHTCIC